MKKNILLLINGFGIEQSNSYNVYTPELMPNLDRLTKERLFVSLSSNDLDYKSGYRSFSIGIKEPLSYSILEKNISSNEYKQNQTMKYIINQANINNSKLHIFCYWDSIKTVEQIEKYIKEILLTLKTRICLHIVLCQKSLNDYNDISLGFRRLNYELSDKVKIGIITGENNFNTMSIKDITKSFITVFGEKWKDLDRKIDVFKSTKTPPFKARTFCVNEDFALEENDQILFFNYSNYDVSYFYNEIQNQKYKNVDFSKVRYYSLFPIKCDSYKIPFAYNYALSSTYTLNSLKSIGAKCLVLDLKEHCSYINYYMTGLRNTIDNDLRYFATNDNFIYDQDKLINFIKDKNQELIIINYEIITCKTVDEIEQRLSKIDEIIGVLDKYASENNIALSISSLYGIEKDMYNEKKELCKINFSVRVPFIFGDTEYSKSSYSLSEGKLYDLSNTILKNINNKYKGDSLLKKKGGLMSVFYKK